MSGEGNQMRVRAFVDQHSLDLPVRERILELSAEVGELSKEFLKTTSHGQKEFRPSEEWQDALGDVYFALLALADKSDVELDDALHKSLSSYEDHLRTTGGPDVRESSDLES